MPKLKLITAMFIFGTIGIFVKYIPLPSDIIALSRGLIGTLFLLLIILINKKSISIDSIKNNIYILFFSGIALGFNWILLFEAFKQTGVAIATLCYYLAPIFVLILSPFILRETLNLTKKLCVIAALIGIVLVSGVLQGDVNEIGITGIILALCAATLYASLILMNKFLKNISGETSTIIQLAVASLVLLPYTVCMENIEAIPEVSTILLVITVGIIHTGIAYYLYFSSIKELKAQTIAIFSYIDPVVAIILATLLLDEAMTIYNTIGAILILGSTLISELSEK